MRFLPVMMLLALVAGCTADTRASPEPSASGSSSSSPTPSDPSGPAGPSSGSTTNPALTPACAEVRAGIDSFNAGDFDATVEHFEAAVPLAEDQLDGSREADELLEAVRWYAQLPPGDYLDASAGSPEFARYKAITLGQCMALDDQPTESPGTSI